MAKEQILSPELEAEANSLGWKLERVFQLETLRWRVMILPAGGYPIDAAALASEVFIQAKNGFQSAIQALRIIKSENKK